MGQPRGAANVGRNHARRTPRPLRRSPGQTRGPAEGLGNGRRVSVIARRPRLPASTSAPLYGEIGVEGRSSGGSASRARRNDRASGPAAPRCRIGSAGPLHGRSESAASSHNSDMPPATAARNALRGQARPAAGRAAAGTAARSHDMPSSAAPSLPILLRTGHAQHLPGVLPVQ
jgi:hypothetical protein